MIIAQQEQINQLSTMNLNKKRRYAEPTSANMFFNDVVT